MRGAAIRGAVAAATVIAMLGPAAGWADQTVEAGPPDRYTTTEITMAQGEKVVFHNGDTVSHDVTASATGSDGKPLFKSALTSSGKTEVVEGTQYLTEGHYDFYCSVHPNMKGSIHVTGDGAPAARPDAPTAGSNNAPSTKPPADRTKPVLRLRIISNKVRIARARHTIVVRMTVSELSHVELRALARPKPGGPLVVVARRTFHGANGTKSVHLKLTRKGRAALRRHRSLAIVVTGLAIDRSGNLSRSEHGRTLAP